MGDIISDDFLEQHVAHVNKVNDYANKLYHRLGPIFRPFLEMYKRISELRRDLDICVESTYPFTS